MSRHRNKRFVAFSAIIFYVLFVSTAHSGSGHQNTSGWHNIAITGSYQKVTRQEAVSQNEWIFINRSQANLKRLVSSMAADINETVPQRFTLPDGTWMTLLFASAQGVRLTYHYRIDSILLEEIYRSQFRRVMRQIVLSQVCTTPLTKILNEGIELAYSYMDAHENYIATIIIHPGDC
jgi:hypothetical protein